MRKQTRWMILVCVPTILPFSACFAQSNLTDSVTITTYYPAPYGVYKNMRLYPSQEPAGAAAQPGAMYFNQTTFSPVYYNGSKWIPFNYFYNNVVFNATTRARQGAPIIGQVYFDIDTDIMYFYNSSGWQPMYGGGGGGGTVCGDGICGQGETTANCPQDCPSTPVNPLSASCQIGGGCSNCATSGNYWEGIKTSILESNCRTYCSDKGKQYDSYSCSDQRTIPYSNTISFSSLSFHDCRPVCPGSCGGGVGVYCYRGAKATCRCK